MSCQQRRMHTKLSSTPSESSCHNLESYSYDEPSHTCCTPSHNYSHSKQHPERVIILSQPPRVIMRVIIVLHTASRRVIILSYIRSNTSSHSTKKRSTPTSRRKVTAAQTQRRELTRYDTNDDEGARSARALSCLRSLDEDDALLQARDAILLPGDPLPDLPRTFACRVYHTLISSRFCIIFQNPTF